MKLRRMLTIGLVLLLMSLGACKGVRELSAELGELSRLQTRLQQQTGQTGLIINLNNNRNLNVSFINSELAKLPPDQKRAKALEVARMAYNDWPKRGELANVGVIFQSSYDLGPIHYSNSLDNFAFQVSELTANEVSTPAGQTAEKGYNIYFIPIGNAPISEINGVMAHYRQKFGLESTVLPHLTPGPSDVNPIRRQLIAENVLALMHKTYSGYVENNSSILIGITSDDIYPLEQKWKFCFGWREPEIRSAVVSTARMNLHYDGEPPSQTNESARLQKMITKDIGIMIYNRSQSNNPHSVLFSGILGIQELDEVSEDF
jgi:predicted Zn-dependent protease